MQRKSRIATSPTFTARAAAPQISSTDGWTADANGKGQGSPSERTDSGIAVASGTINKGGSNCRPRSEEGGQGETGRLVFTTGAPFFNSQPFADYYLSTSTQLSLKFVRVA